MIDVSKHLPPEWRAQIRAEQRRARQAADMFVRTCRDGHAEQLYKAHLLLNECGKVAWRLAMRKIARLPCVSLDIQAAFIPIWVESKMLPLRVGHRPTMAAALRVFMPSRYSGPPLVLYRGTDTQERRRRTYGFSWTSDIATARSFAEYWSQPEGREFQFQGLDLQTEAPPQAVLLIRKPEEYYDEGEVVVNPFRLGKVEVVEQIPVAGNSDA